MKFAIRAALAALSIGSIRFPSPSGPLNQRTRTLNISIAPDASVGSGDPVVIAMLL